MVSIVSGEARDAIAWRCGTADSGLPEGIYAGAILPYSVRNVEPINTTHRIVIAAARPGLAVAETLLRQSCRKEARPA